MCRCSDCAAIKRERDLLRAIHEAAINIKGSFGHPTANLYEKYYAARAALEAEYPAYREMRGDK